MNQFGKQPPRYSLLLNPYEHDRFAVCPRCAGELTDHRIPLLILIQPAHPLALDITCRLCTTCDLLLVPQSDMERGMAEVFAPSEPEVIGNEYQVLGTIDLADWERSARTPLTQEELIACLHDFKERLVLMPLDEEQPSPAPKPRRRSESVPKALQATFASVVERTDAFCLEHLNDEYAQLCREMAAALCRKRPSPLAQGKPATWACAILYALGQVNFLFDRSQTPYLSAGDLSKLCGISMSTASAKAKLIRDALHIDLMDPRWTLPSLLANNPLAWMITVDGLLVDARHAPRAIQEEALRLGLIPYLP